MSATEPELTISLFAKIAKVQATIGGLKTDKRASIQGRDGRQGYSYDYISDSRMMAELRRLLSPLGVAVLISVVDEQKNGNLTTVWVAVTFADGETGTTFTIKGVGYGTDPGDKGVGKAQTSAIRYALTKTFLQGGDADPEQEDVQHQPAAEPRRALTPRPSPRPSQPAAGETRTSLERVFRDQVASWDTAEKLDLMRMSGCKQAPEFVAKYGERVRDMGGVFVELQEAERQKKLAGEFQEFADAQPASAERGDAAAPAEFRPSVLGRWVSDANQERAEPQGRLTPTMPSGDAS